MEISGNTYYVNPNNRTLTTNLKNTAITDKEAFSVMQDHLCPVDDMNQVLTTPIRLAARTALNKTYNSINLADGAAITVRGGFSLTVTERGVTVSGGNVDNESAWQEASDMAGALSKLLRNASGIMKNVANSSSSHRTWTENVSKVLSYWGIDTTKDFTVNDMKYTRDTNGNIVSEETVQAKKAYEQLKASNLTYEYANEKNKKQIHYISDYYLKTVPESVKTAWKETMEKTGINPFPNGYTSVFQRISMEQDFATKGNDNILGNTVESSIEGIKTVLNRINFMYDESIDDTMLLQSEKEFYSVLLTNIERMS